MGLPLGVNDAGAAAAVAAVDRAERGTGAREVQGGSRESPVVQEPQGSGGQRSRHAGNKASTHEPWQNREVDSAIPCTAQEDVLPKVKPEDDATEHGAAGGWRDLSTGAACEDRVPHAIVSEVGGVRGRDGVVMLEEYKRARGPPGALRVSVHTSIGMPEVRGESCLFVLAIPLLYSTQ